MSMNENGTNDQLTALMAEYLQPDATTEPMKTKAQAVKQNTAAMAGNRWRHTEINEELYSIELLGARKGVPIGLKLKGVVLPMIARGIDGLRDEEMFEAPQTFTELAYILTQQLESLDIENMIFDNILAKISHNGVFVEDTDEFFAANYGVMVELLAFALKENFASVFTVGGLTSNIQTKVKSLLAGFGKDSTPKDTIQK